MSYTQSENDLAPTAAGHGGDISHIEPDNIGVGMLVVLFGFCAVGILLMTILLQAWFYNWKVDLLAQRPDETDTQQTPVAIATLQRQQIENYGWTDGKIKTRAIPISRAMELVAADLAAESSKETGQR